MSMTGFTERAVENGAKIWKDAEVTAIERDAQGVCGVKTKKGRVTTRKLVIAAGAWSAPVAEMAGVDLHVHPLRRMLVPSEPFDEYPHSAPMTIDMSTGFHFRPEGRGFLLAWNDAEETYGDKQWFEPSFLEKVLTHAASRVPCFEHLPVNPKRAWAGLYEMTPDHHPVLGPVKAVPGLYIATGFSGHGVMHAPATGKLMSEFLLLGRPELVDATVFGVERFAEGKLIHETAVL
jgi:sarcosine oxidase subunit beta